jgi:hypothetical protein
MRNVEIPTVERNILPLASRVNTNQFGGVSTAISKISDWDLGLRQQTLILLPTWRICRQTPLGLICVIDAMMLTNTIDMSCEVRPDRKVRFNLLLRVDANCVYRPVRS